MDLTTKYDEDSNSKTKKVRHMAVKFVPSVWLKKIKKVLKKLLTIRKSYIIINFVVKTCAFSSAG